MTPLKHLNMTPFPREQFEILMTLLLVLKPEGQYHFYTIALVRRIMYFILDNNKCKYRVTKWQSHIMTFIF